MSLIKAFPPKYLINDLGLLLPELKPYKRPLKNHQFGASDIYGSSYVLNLYCGRNERLNHLNEFWVHGCNAPWERIDIAYSIFTNRRLNTRYFVARQDQKDLVSQLGIPNVEAIGLPMCYVTVPKVDRLKKSLLIIPTHTANNYNIREYLHILENILKEVDAVRCNYNLICISLFHQNLKSKEITDLVKSYNIPILTGAHHNDKNALFRQKLYFQQFETVYSNGWGSHIAYALANGCKLSIKQEEVTHYTLRNNVIEQRVKAGYTNEAGKHAMLSEFFVPLKSAKKDEELGNFLIGNGHKRSPAEIRNLLNWNVFNELKNARKLLRYNKNFKDF